MDVTGKSLKTNSKGINMIGDKIRDLRMSNRYTQDDLAKKLKISKSTIGMYEQNRRSPDLDILLKLSRIFHVSTDYLLGNTTNSIFSKPQRIVEKIEPNLELIGIRIRNLREDNDLTQKELAQLICLTPKMISFYENNQRTPPIDILAKLAQIFKVSIDYLVGYNSNTESHNNKPLSLSWEKICELYPNAMQVSSEIQDLIVYYEQLSLNDKRWIMGQMIDLIKKSEAKNQSSKAQ